MNTSRNIEDLSPSFQPIVREVILRAEARGLYPFVTEGTRSREYQACLYASGRMPEQGAMVFGGKFEVVTRVDATRGVVIATCGAVRTMRLRADWRRVVTRTLDSWHTVGLAVDLAFRSGPGRNDYIVADLERARRWSEIESLYARMHAVWLEVCPSIRWGNDWDRDGIVVKDDPDESLVDMPHWEWHPGRTLADVLAGRWPAGIPQCPRCRNFTGTLIEGASGVRCGACSDGKVAVAR